MFFDIRISLQIAGKSLRPNGASAKEIRLVTCILMHFSRVKIFNSLLLRSQIQRLLSRDQLRKCGVVQLRGLALPTHNAVAGNNGAAWNAFHFKE